MKHIVIDINKKRENLFKLHSITQKFISELEFLHDEQRFLQDLLSSFFIDLCRTEILPRTRILNKEIDKSNKECNLLIFELQTHEKQLATLLESKHLKGEEYFRKAHSELSNQVEMFIRASRNLKTTIFTITKKIIKQRKQKKLLPGTNAPKVKNSTD